MNRYAMVQDIVTRLTDDLVFRTFFTLYLMADSDTERAALDAKFWRDASALDTAEQQLLSSELTKTFLRLPLLINQLHKKVTVSLV